MKRALILFLSLFMLISGATAQQYRFIYLQTENQQTFFVKLNNLVYSSSPSGYLIIPKLTDGSYELEIGFPRNDYPSQMVNCVLAGKDEGFLLKNLGNETWGLFNLRTLQLATAKPGKIGEATPAPDKNSFEGALSNVVETDLNKKNRRKGKTETKKAASTVTLISYNIDAVGLHRNYIVENEGEKDTVQVLFEGNYQPAAKQEVKQDKVVKDEAPAVRFIEDEPKKVTMINSNCSKDATENHFLKLRKNMASKSKDSDMITQAKKAYKKHCYTTEQIRSLAVLLMTDASKYEFLDLSYQHTSDSENYGSLRTLITDTYYLNRFDALIRK